MSIKAPKMTAYEAWLGMLSPETKQALTSEPVAEKAPPTAIIEWLPDLSPQAQACLGAMKTEPESPSDQCDSAEMRYCVAECKIETGWLQVRVFKTLKGAARYVGKADGTDAIVWVFYGVPLQISTGPNRYMTTPGGRKLVVLPQGGPGEVRLIDEDLVEFVPQEDGFMGPPELSDPVEFERQLDEQTEMQIPHNARDVTPQVMDPEVVDPDDDEEPDVVDNNDVDDDEDEDDG